MVVKDPHAAWLLATWRARPRRRPRPAAAHRAAPPGRGGRLAGPDLGRGPATEAERRVKETSNTAAWLNVALVTELARRDAPRAFLRYDDLLDDWRTALGRVADQLDLDLPLGEERGLDEFLDPGMRRSQLTWADLVLPDWLRDRPRTPGSSSAPWSTTPPTGGRGRLEATAAAYAAHYAEAVAVCLDEARHRERRGTAAGAAKIRGRLQGERAAAQGRPRPARRSRRGQSTKRAARPDPAQVAVGEPRRHELVGRPEVLGHRAHGRLGQRGRARRDVEPRVQVGLGWSMPRSREQPSAPRRPCRVEQLLVEARSAPPRRTPRPAAARCPRSGSARRRTARRTAARPAPRRCRGCCAGRRRFCIRTCDQIRSTGSRRRNAATARTPAPLELVADPGQPLGRQQGVAGRDVQGQPGPRRTAANSAVK